jgi:hypothetical protein
MPTVFVKVGKVVGENRLPLEFDKLADPSSIVINIKEKHTRRYGLTESRMCASPRSDWRRSSP